MFFRTDEKVIAIEWAAEVFHETSGGIMDKLAAAATELRVSTKTISRWRETIVWQEKIKEITDAENDT